MIPELTDRQDKDISKKSLKRLFRLILTPFTSFIFILRIYILPPISISQTIPPLLYLSASCPTHLLVQSITSSFDRIGTGREIAVPIGRTEGIPYRWKNKLSFERSSNDLREQRILMTECPMSSAFHPVFLVIYVAKERERKIFWHWIFRRPIRRGMIAFSRTWTI